MANEKQQIKDSTGKTQVKNPPFTRRKFIRNTSLTTAGFYIVPRHVLGRGYVAPSDRLLIAGVGAGGKGGSNLRHFSAAIKQKYTNAKPYMVLFPIPQSVLNENPNIPQNTGY